MKRLVAAVIGLKRSGTSLLARVLAEAGVCMGEHFLPDHPDWSADGLYEDADFADLADRIFQSRPELYNGRIVSIGDAALLDEFRDFIRERCKKYDRWGVKLFSVPYLFHEMAAHTSAPPVLLVTRRLFCESVYSFQSRDRGQSLNDTLLGFAHALYNVDAVWKTYGGPKMEVSFDAMLAEPVKMIRKVTALCGLEFDSRLALLVRKELRRF